MNRGFKYLADMYGDSGARIKFEEICQSLMQSMFESAYTVECYPGDDGIDVYIKDEEKINVYQCKYFVDRIKDVQKSQIKNSLKVLMESIHKKRVKKWILCMPTTLTSKEHDWWLKWSEENRKKYEIEIELIDETNLLNLLRKNNLYKDNFEIIEIDKNMLKELSKTKYIDSMAIIINEINKNDFRYSDVKFISQCDDIVNKYSYDPIFKDSNLIIAIDSLSEIISYNVQNGIISNQQILDKIKVLREEILKEYKDIFY